MPSRARRRASGVSSRVIQTPRAAGDAPHSTATTTTMTELALVLDGEAPVRKKEVERGNKVLVTPLYGVRGANEATTT